MFTTTGSMMALTAGDLMSRNVVLIPVTLPLREAAELLVRNHIGGAPVVDEDGKCIGVISAIDFLRRAEKHTDVMKSLSPARPVTCSFQEKRRMPDGREVYLCTLPPGVCPIQYVEKEPGGSELLICREPHCVLADWQIVELEKLPTLEVRNYMTPDPVTADADVPIRTLARQMIDAHIHRIIVVDEGRKPIGIVSNTDLLATIAYSEDGE